MNDAKFVQSQRSESIFWMILEDQAFWRSFELAPRPTPTPPPPVSKLERRHTGRLRKRDNMRTGEGGGEEPQEMPGPL